MPRVYNWQLGREMEYAYEGARPRRQFAGVFDINKCIACQTCTIACKTTWTSGPGQEYMLWNNVETKPRGFYPVGYDVEILSALGPQRWDGERYAGRTIFEAAPEGERVLGWRPDALDYANPNIGEDEIAGQIDRGAAFGGEHPQWMFYLMRTCNHCTYPACLASCPRGSIYKRPEDGIVLVDQDRCRGYQECVRGCPYKKVYFNPVTGTSEKCIGCYPKIEQGEASQCFAACIGKLRIQGWISTPEQAREDNPIDYLVHVRKLAVPLMPQLGLEPNIYYIPPIHVPESYLVQMFGPRAPAAVRAYREAREDPVLRGLLVLFGSTNRIVWRFRVQNDVAVAYGEDGSELVRVPVTEPVVVRPAMDRLYQIRRENTT
ncbi:MAG: dehydrogenase [Myxococcota bacterium]|nr:dehydrogenase [Myxococcota bacterium]MDW8363941.1 4Fe-4S dicluster domain-containing protein [Myxococcales bacterium]